MLSAPGRRLLLYVCEFRCLIDALVVVKPNAMKRRRRGPRGSAFFKFADKNFRQMKSQLAANAPVAKTADKDKPRSSSARQMQHSAWSRPLPADTVHDEEDPSMASESDGDGIPSEDTDFSSAEEVVAGEFASRREFVCFTYLFGGARVTLRKYDIMREAENSFDPGENWPSRWRLQQLRNHMLNSAAPVRKETTTRQLPSGKEKALRRLPDVSVSYLTFSEHIKRDFGDPGTASLFHSDGDARMGTVERPAEFFQTIAARDPARYTFKEAFVFNRYRYGFGCIAEIFLDSKTKSTAKLNSTAIATDDEVTISPATYADSNALRVGDLPTCFEVLPGIFTPEPWNLCVSSQHTVTLRMSRAGEVFVINVWSAPGREIDSWTALTAPIPIELAEEASPAADNLPGKDAYTTYVSLYGDEFSVYKRGRGSLEGYYGAYTFLALADCSFSVRPLFYLPPGACPEMVIARIIDDIINLSKDGLVVYDAFKKEEVVDRAYLSLAVFDSPMAVKFSSSIGPSGTEHCTSCNIVHPKTKSHRKERAVSSTESFDVQDTRYSRVQERTHAIMSAVKRSVDQSADSLREALLLNGVTDRVESQLMRIQEGRGPGSFDIHEHIIVAPSHLLYYNLGSHLLMEAHDALSVHQRETFTKEMRRSAKHVPTHSIRSSFEPERMGGTTLTMSDYTVLITVSPTVLQYLVHTNTTSPHADATLSALKALRQFAAALFYRPTISIDGESAMRERPTVADLQRLGEGLMSQLRLLLPFEGKWERPSVHRVLELLYRNLPLAQLGSAICELIFEKFHQQAKREVEQSSNRNSAEYAMQRWRDIETLQRSLSMHADHSIPPSCLLGENGKPLKSVVFHQIAPQKRYTAATLNTWCPWTALHAVSATTEEFWRSRAPNAAVRFWRKARHPQRALTIREGVSMSISSRAQTSTKFFGSYSVGGEAVHFVRVQTIGTIDGDIYPACLA